MTKQSVVVPETGIAVAAVPYQPPRTVAATAAAKPCVGSNEVGITGLVDTMRSSSPTRRPVAVAEEEDGGASWEEAHPSALVLFDQIVEASQGKQIVMFLDYDGTLSPIVVDPEAAFMSDKMRSAVRSVAQLFPTAIVTGRCRSKVFEFVRLTELYYAGSHGMDIAAPASDADGGGAGDEVHRPLFQPANEFLPTIQEVFEILVEKTQSIPGAKVENNIFCLSVHYRSVEEQSWAPLAELVRSVMENYPTLKLTQGRKVLEIRPSIKWDKGKALEFLLESLGFADSDDVFPMYIGDDRTDEDAFKVLRERGQGLGILVTKSPKETLAFYTLQDPDEVMRFLLRLVEWKTGHAAAADDDEAAVESQPTSQPTSPS